MFGHQDDTSQQSQTATYSDPAASSVPDPVAATTPVNDAYVTAASPDVPASEPLLESQASDGYSGESAAPTSAPALAEPAAVSTPAPASADDSAPAATPVGANELLDIKQQALQQLSPLVGHLDQSPEEKFRTTMMMIQASDNQDLIQTAYEMAGQISDEKTRAQALLDIVNEINYFTQHNAGN